MNDENETFKSFRHLIDVGRNGIDRIFDAANSEELQNQTEQAKQLSFGAGIYILLLTDRLPECAGELQIYLRNSTDIKVDLVYDLKEARGKIEAVPIDFLIIVGMFKKKENYIAAREAAEKNKNLKVVMFAGEDSVIAQECARFGIAYRYNRFSPVTGLIPYLRELYFSRVQFI